MSRSGRLSHQIFGQIVLLRSAYSGQQRESVFSKKPQFPHLLMEESEIFKDTAAESYNDVR